jgi:heme oxygenase
MLHQPQDISDTVASVAVSLEDISASKIVKQYTQDAHRGLESTMCMRQLMSDSLTVPEYHNILKRWNVWLSLNYTPITNALSENNLPDISERGRQSHLHEDINALDHLISCQVEQSPQATMPKVESITIYNADYALGCLYVLEGSTLGAALITRHLRAHFDTGIPCRFYASYGVNTPRMWHCFVEHFDSRLTSEKSILEACRGAKTTFESLKHCFN